MKRYHWLTLLVLIFCPPLYAETLTKKEFTKQYIVALKKIFPAMYVDVISDLHLFSRDKMGNETNIYLDSAYQVYKSGSKPIKAIFSQHIDTFKSQRFLLEQEPKDLILPIIKSRTYIQTFKRENSYVSDDELPFHVEPLNKDLVMIYARQSDMDAYLSFNELYQKEDIDGLKSRSAKNIAYHFDRVGVSIQQIDTEDSGKIYLLAVDGALESSALVNQRFWSKKTIPVAGRFIAFAPTRDILFVVGSKDRVGLRKAKKLAADAYRELDNPISPHGYIRRKGQWQRLNNTK